jgi:hypothetical protein
LVGITAKRDGETTILFIPDAEPHPEIKRLWSDLQGGEKTILTKDYVVPKNIIKICPEDCPMKNPKIKNPKERANERRKLRKKLRR